MKKTLFYYMLPALVFASCARDRSYTVEAEVDPSYNGKTAYMLDYHDGSVVDSTVYDVAGVCQLQMHGLHNEVDVAALGKGVYLYRGMDTEGSSIAYKFIK